MCAHGEAEKFMRVKIGSLGGGKAVVDGFSNDALKILKQK